jgi:hypothetical protein
MANYVMTTKSALIELSKRVLRIIARRQPNLELSARVHSEIPVVRLQRAHLHIVANDGGSQG